MIRVSLFVVFSLLAVSCHSPSTDNGFATKQVGSFIPLGPAKQVENSGERFARGCLKQGESAPAPAQVDKRVLPGQIYRSRSQSLVRGGQPMNISTSEVILNVSPLEIKSELRVDESTHSQIDIGAKFVKTCRISRRQDADVSVESTSCELDPKIEVTQPKQETCFVVQEKSKRTVTPGIFRMGSGKEIQAYQLETLHQGQVKCSPANRGQEVSAGRGEYRSITIVSNQVSASSWYIEKCGGSVVLDQYSNALDTGEILNNYLVETIDAHVFQE